jgi:hypothetical protein
MLACPTTSPRSYSSRKSGILDSALPSEASGAQAATFKNGQNLALLFGNEAGVHGLLWFNEDTGGLVDTFVCTWQSSYAQTAAAG